MVTYVNPILPELRQVFHPFIPLSMSGIEPFNEHRIDRGNGCYSEDATADYFRRHGWPVPPGGEDDGR